jgi:hypothetical protein
LRRASAVVVDKIFYLMAFDQFSIDVEPGRPITRLM